MKRFLLSLGLLGVMGFSVAGWAEEVTVFSAAEAGQDAWTWEGARLTEEGANLKLAKDKGESCDVVLADRFTYLPDGVVEFSVDRVVSGTYSIQVLAFKGGDYLGAVDLVKDSMFAGTKTVPLKDLKLPAETRFVTFKLWISKDLGSSVLFKEIRYYVPVVQRASFTIWRSARRRPVSWIRPRGRPAKKAAGWHLYRGVPWAPSFFRIKSKSPRAGNCCSRLRT